MNESGDVFDLIEFPLEYEFKVVFQRQDTEQLLAEVKQIGLEWAASNDMLGLDHRPSRKGKYVSVSMKLNLHNRNQLEGIYGQLSAMSGALMTL